MTGAEETEEEVEFERRDSPKKRTKTRRRKREFPNTLWEYLKQEVRGILFLSQFETHRTDDALESHFAGLYGRGRWGRRDQI